MAKMASLNDSSRALLMWRSWDEMSVPASPRVLAIR
jgi:hypothetical protein